MTHRTVRRGPATHTHPAPDSIPEPILRIHDAQLRFGRRVVWHGLDLDVSPGEFIAVLGPNGSGKTSLLKVLLGQNRLHSGSAEIAGHPVRSGSRAVGYVPQQRGVDPQTPLRARDLVRLGIDGDRWGLGLPSRKITAQVDRLLASVGALEYADAPVGTLSGGELQRLRLAQALASDPRVLLCDEPLLSLDITHQHLVARLLDEQRRERDTAILFVTHEINPILPYVDRVLYIVGGHFLVGRPHEVITTAALTRLYGYPVEVVEAAGRLLIVGGDDEGAHHPAQDGSAA